MAYKPPSNNNGRTHGGGQTFSKTIAHKPTKTSNHTRTARRLLLRLLGVVYPALGVGGRELDSLHPDHCVRACRVRCC